MLGLISDASEDSVLDRAHAIVGIPFVYEQCGDHVLIGEMRYLFVLLVLHRVLQVYRVCRGGGNPRVSIRIDFWNSPRNGLLG